MSAELNQHIDQLRQMTTTQLQLKYRELFGQTSHSNHKDYLFRRVAWRMQAGAEGGLSERAREHAREIAIDADLRLCAPKKLVGAQPAVQVANASRQLDPRVPAPGTQLIKRYKDEILTVTVLADEYQYGERVYKSLSAIARQVTGTQWNGYVFFGLRFRSRAVRSNHQAPARMPETRVVRCAIYARKSTEEGLSQPFNSLSIGAPATALMERSREGCRRLDIRCAAWQARRL